METTATLRRVDALIYLHQLLKLWLAPHVVTSAVMLALLIVHIIQVVFFVAALDNLFVGEVSCSAGSIYIIVREDRGIRSDNFGLEGVEDRARSRLRSPAESPRRLSLACRYQRDRGTLLSHQSQPIEFDNAQWQIGRPGRGRSACQRRSKSESAPSFCASDRKDEALDSRYVANRPADRSSRNPKGSGRGSSPGGSSAAAPVKWPTLSISFGASVRERKPHDSRDFIRAGHLDWERPDLTGHLRAT